STESPGSTWKRGRASSGERGLSAPQSVASRAKVAFTASPLYGKTLFVRIGGSLLFFPDEVRVRRGVLHPGRVDMASRGFGKESHDPLGSSLSARRELVKTVQVDVLAPPARCLDPLEDIKREVRAGLENDLKGREGVWIE